MHVIVQPVCCQYMGTTGAAALWARSRNIVAVMSAALRVVAAAIVVAVVITIVAAAVIVVVAVVVVVVVPAAATPNSSGVRSSALSHSMRSCSAQHRFQL